MHHVRAGRWLNRALRMGEASTRGVPVFLCPAVGLCRAAPPFAEWRPRPSRRLNHAQTAPVVLEADRAPEPLRELPVTCSGCGAFAQTTDADQLGYFDLQTKRVRVWLRPRPKTTRQPDAVADDIVADVLKGLGGEKLKELGLDADAMLGGDAEVRAQATSPTEKPLICDRCHQLQHHSTAWETARMAIYHPTVESLRETIEESPHKYNHIYHVIDAADFPLSLIPRLNVLLGDIPLRSKNRRSRSSKFRHDRKTEMSFIITRSDLLAPTKVQVDAMLPCLREVLRDALGRLGGRVRLGNLRLVSGRGGWWTRELKEEIWDRGGAGWMVGKVNVGKSQLFEAVFPKGRMAGSGAVAVADGKHVLDVGELLPPAQPAVNYPAMPMVSSVPGTTASPIRVPFGGGKGELIDLPGLVRSDLELHVREEHRQSLVMRNRITPVQISVKADKSLILGGGLIRLTPKTPDTVFLMYNFTPLASHLTATEKAIAYQDQTLKAVVVDNIATPDAADKMKHAGTFTLRHDVTKKRAGPLTRKNAVGLRVDDLPFRVVSVDILIEGVGYVEVVAQVRRRDFDRLSGMQQARDHHAGRADELSPPPPSSSSLPGPDDMFAEMARSRRAAAPDERISREDDVLPPEPDWPAVDVYTPEGRFVGSRQPINGWENNQPRTLEKHLRNRPRRSMRGVKKAAKQALRRLAPSR